ncbi:hypothetical protein K1719_030214 [Acacia pycnantha]|nr:hypothetical protein K1719_030214 [Acacia pycnantha]
MSVPSDRTVRGGESEAMIEEDREEWNRRKRKVRFAAEEFTGEESIKAREEQWMKLDLKEQAPMSQGKGEAYETFSEDSGSEVVGKTTFLRIHGQEAEANLGKKRWKPEFNPKFQKMDSVVAWVRFPDLPAPLFDKKFLLNLGNSIGKAIRLDIHTAQRARGKFLRMCVELDLTKPLVPKFSVDGKVLSVVYESLGLLCKNCGCFGHTKEGCEAFTKKHNEEGMDVEGLDEINKSVPAIPEVKELWKTVQRPNRQRRNVAPMPMPSMDSRFSILNECEGDGDRRVGSEKEKGEKRSGVFPTKGLEKGDN